MGKNNDNLINENKPLGGQLTVNWQIGGMHCNSCAKGIQQKLSASAGVVAAQVNFASESLCLTFASDKTDAEKLAAVITAAGYQVKNQPGQKSAAEQENNNEQPVKMPWQPLLLLIPLELITAVRHFFYPDWLAQQPELLSLVQLGLALAIFYQGRELLKNGLLALRRLQPNMNSLVALACFSAMVYSMILTTGILLGKGDFLGDLSYETGALILFFVLLGHFFENRSKRKGRSAIAGLAKLQPQYARCITVNGEQNVAVDELQPGDRVIVRPGERVPADGRIITGQPWIDMSIISGESLPVQKAVGDEVVGGTLNQNSSFTFTVEKVGANSVLARITQMVLQAQGSQMPINLLADRISAVFVPLVIVLAVISGVVWYFVSGQVTTALTRLIVVLIISCPCALGLATPMAVMVAIGKALRSGVIVRHGEILERLRSITTIVFDKTGTITEGTPTVSDVIADGQLAEEKMLFYAACGESHSEHPLAQSVLDYCRQQGIAYSQPQNFQNYPGQGVSYQVEQHNCLLGSISFLQQQDVKVAASNEVARLQQQGKTIIALAVDRQSEGLIAIQDQLRTSSPATIARLKKLQQGVVLLSGDHRRTANAIGRQSGIEEIIAEVLPQDKQQKVRQLQQQGQRVMMVGDGVNDAPALAQADVGVAMGNGSDIAHESAGIILLNDDPYNIVRTLRLGQATVAIIKQNLFLAFAYNLIAIPLAAGVFVPLGLPRITPVIAAPLMALSSITVVLNALRLEKKKYD